MWSAPGGGERSTGRLTLYFFFRDRDLEWVRVFRECFDFLSWVVSAGNSSVNSILHLP